MLFLLTFADFISLSSVFIDILSILRGFS